MYAVMGEALLHALGKRLGERFPSEAAQAWSKAFNFVSAVMTSESKQAHGRTCHVM